MPDVYRPARAVIVLASQILHAWRVTGGAIFISGSEGLTVSDSSSPVSGFLRMEMADLEDLTGVNSAA